MWLVSIVAIQHPVACTHTARCRGEAKSCPCRARCRPGWCPGIASRAGGAGLTGRNRKCGVAVSRDFPCHACISLECDGAVGGGAFGFWGLVRFRSSRDSGSCAFAALLRLRPVRPARSAWHEMPGWAFSGLRRPARAALSRNLPCAGWYAWDVARLGNGGLVCAEGACWSPRHKFRRRCECEPGHGDHVHPQGALQGWG